MKKNIAETILDRLFLVPVGDVDDIETQRLLVSTYGEDRATELINMIHLRGESTQNNAGGKRFYSMKNTVLLGSLILSSCFEYDYYVNLLTYIFEHPELIGDRVLDVGCDCGILSCAIALMFPKKTVVGIDRCRNAILSAEELAQKAEVDNVKFIKTDIMSFEDSPFSTILSSKIAHEISTDPNSEFPLKVDLIEYANIFKKTFTSYVNKLSSLCTEGGRLLSIERFGLHPMGLGYTLALSENGFRSIPNKDTLIINKSRTDANGKPEGYPVYCAIRETHPINSELAYEAFTASCFAQALDFSGDDYYSWDSLIVFHSIRGDFIYGYDFYENNVLCGELTIWHLKDDPMHVIIKRVIKNNAHCWIDETTSVPKIKEEIENDPAFRSFTALVKS